MALAAAGMALLVAAPGAPAATVSQTNITTYQAAADEDNALAVRDAGANLEFEDQVPVTPVLPCVPGADPNTALCPKTGIVDINLENLDDDTTIDGIDFTGFMQRGGSGEDTLRGSTGSASSTFVGGEGTDTYVNGAGFDAVSYSDKTAPLTASFDDQPNDPDGENVAIALDGLAGGAGDDTIIGSGLIDYLFGGAGNDTIDGLGSADWLDGQAGTDTLNGDGGHDNLIGGEHADVLNGGLGLDTMDYREKAMATTVTLDDQPNDGLAGEGDNARADTEAILGSPSADTLTGDGGENQIAGSSNADSITGGGAEDELSGDSGNDTIHARDGVPDTISCGPGDDTANVDDVDEVPSDCETVNRPSAGGSGESEDRPPAVAFASPAEDALIGAGHDSTIEVSASDDREIRRVVLTDDGRMVGTDTTAPYEFSYRPRSEDVGANTLEATAVDSAEQPARAARRVRVDRFLPGFNRRVRPRRDRRRPFRFRVSGGLALPPEVTPAAGCRAGTVAIQVRRGPRAVLERRVSLTPACRFSAALRLRGRRRLTRGRLRVSARFRGNDVLKPRAARPVRVRAG